MEVRVVSEGDDGAWGEATVGTLVEIVRRGYELLVKEDVVTRAVEDLQGAIDPGSAPETVPASSGSPGDPRPDTSPGGVRSQPDKQ